MNKTKRGSSGKFECARLQTSPRPDKTTQERPANGHKRATTRDGASSPAHAVPAAAGLARLSGTCIRVLALVVGDLLRFCRSGALPVGGNSLQDREAWDDPKLGLSFPWPFSHLSGRSRGGGKLTLPPACCDTAITILCTASMVFGMDLECFKVSSFSYDVVQACRQDMACICNFLSFASDWCLVMPRSTNVCILSCNT